METNLGLNFRWDYAISIAVGIGTAFIGGWDLALKVLLILMGIDIVTGLIKAFYLAKYNSRAFRKGLLSKAGFFLVIILAYQIDVVVNNGEPMVRNMATMFYIAVEGSSIVENLALMGIPMPKVIKDRLSVISEKVEEQKQEVINKDLSKIEDIAIDVVADKVATDEAKKEDISNG